MLTGDSVLTRCLARCLTHRPKRFIAGSFIRYSSFYPDEGLLAWLVLQGADLPLIYPLPEVGEGHTVATQQQRANKSIASAMTVVGRAIVQRQRERGRQREKIAMAVLGEEREGRELPATLVAMVDEYVGVGGLLLPASSSVLRTVLSWFDDFVSGPNFNTQTSPGACVVQ